MNPIKVEVGQYRELNKGNSLKAFFSLVIYPEGQKILDCRYFENGDQRWFSFPQKEIKYSDGRKTEYIPLISYMNKDYLEQLKIAVLNALKTAKPQAQNGKAQSYSKNGQTNSLSTQASSDPDELPF